MVTLNAGWYNLGLEAVYASDPALLQRPQHSLSGGSLRFARTGEKCSGKPTAVSRS